MPLRKDQLWIAAVILVFLATITIPYLIARPADADMRFGGFLVNPIDGHSYLAKMRQGYEGSWTFTLPYTAEPGEGTAINLYYLFLGHIARTFGLPLLFAFHSAQIAGGLVLALALQRLFSVIFQSPNQRLAALVLALFGSGLGWIAFTFGMFTGDFWVAEAFPFLASFTNAHFPIGMALQVLLLTPLRSTSKPALVTSAVTAVLLSIIYPFGWVTTVAVMVGWAAWLVARNERWIEHAKQAAAVIVGGLPYAAYALLITNTHPVLMQWNAQNQTPALSPLDLLISLSPVVLVATAALLSWRRLLAPARMFAIWLVVGVLVLYVPVNLQRRLISGLYIPAAGLAVWVIANKLSKVKWRRLAYIGLFAFSLPTNLLIMFGGLQAVRAGDEAVVVSQAELDAYAWLDQHASGGLVLASPESGLRLPAYSSVRVLYAHPFETVNAAENKEMVEAFFSGGAMVEELDVDYVFYGPRESDLGPLEVRDSWDLLYDHDGVKIWVVGQE